MVLTNYRKLFREFINGAVDGQNRKVEIVDDGDRTLLVGYKHCVYATRNKENGRITLYEGWADSARATNASNMHVGALRQELDGQSMFHQVAKQSRVDTLQRIDGGEYDSFAVEASQ